MKADSTTRFGAGIGSGERGRNLDRIAALEAENVALRAALGDIASHGCLRHGDEGWTCRQKTD